MLLLLQALAAGFEARGVLRPCVTLRAGQCHIPWVSVQVGVPCGSVSPFGVTSVSCQCHQLMFPAPPAQATCDPVDVLWHPEIHAELSVNLGTLQTEPLSFGSFGAANTEILGSLGRSWWVRTFCENPKGTQEPCQAEV